MANVDHRRADIPKNLLPLAKRFARMEGACDTRRGWEVEFICRDPRVESAWHRIASVGAFGSGGSVGTAASVGSGGVSGAASGRNRVRIEVDPSVAPSAQGYRLCVEPNGICLVGASPAGCFYGLQTLRQMMALRAGMLPACVIEDAPDFAVRGVLLDVTRGRVPLLRTLKALVDRLASWKINHVQLYIEHAFTFAFDPEICGPDHGLTPDEVRSLDAFCGERFVTLVPALATLGHMGRVLSMPRYRRWAEIAPARGWSRMDWATRARGLTIDVVSGGSLGLVERMWSDVLDAFPGPFVNICGDEPHDLGRGRNRGLTPAERTRAYVERVRETCRIVAHRDRRALMWGDVLRQDPALAGQLPGDLTVLHWGYDDQTDYDAVGRFVRAGVETWVCPGTSGWKRLINPLSQAERNICTFARRGHRAGASGLLVTDWGDHGHVNMLGASLHGMALAAGCGWCVAEPGGEPFDRRFARWVLDRDRTGAAGVVRAAGAAGAGDVPDGPDDEGVADVADALAAWRRMTAFLGQVETWIRLRRSVDGATILDRVATAGLGRDDPTGAGPRAGDSRLGRGMAGGRPTVGATASRPSAALTGDGSGVAWRDVWDGVAEACRDFQRVLSRLPDGARPGDGCRDAYRERPGADARTLDLSPYDAVADWILAAGWMEVLADKERFACERSAPDAAGARKSAEHRDRSGTERVNRDADRGTGVDRTGLSGDGTADACERMDRLRSAYARRWAQTSKPGGLDDVDRVLAAVCADLRCTGRPA